MPKVTDKQYSMPKFLIEKLDIASYRVKKRELDAVFLVDGDEGFGKTSISVLSAYYCAYKTGRKFTLDNVFFDPNKLLKFINSTEKQVIIWDEAALGGLASGWQNKVQQMLIQTLMTCRSRRHILFFNCPKFYRLNRYFISDRAIGLIHVYSEDGINAGPFAYYKKDWLDKMIDFYTKKKSKAVYKVFYNTRLRSTFIDAFSKTDILDKKEYEKKKNQTTQKLLSQYGGVKGDGKLLKLQYAFYCLKGVTQQKKAKCAGITRQTLSEWGKIPEKYPEFFRKTE